MANRRFGGPPQKLGGFGQQNFQGNKVSPWQGGAAPNMNSGGLLSQLSAPQAQLALAITNLLQNQQSMNNNPPSLLSLPTPGFHNQDNFGSQNRFNNRGRDFRRLDPYGKNQNQNRGGNATWRDNSTRPSGSFGGGRSLASSGGSGSRSKFGNKDTKSLMKGGNFKRNDGKGKNSNKAIKTGDKVNDSSKKQKDDLSVDENREEDGTENEKKRDWKQEKNVEGQDEEGETANQEGTAMDSVDLTDDNVQNGANKEKKQREGRYQGVPTNLLHCFVCNKSMWDGESFQNHIRGKAHKQMMDSLGHSFQITVNILRENMRLTEEKKMIELERVHRNNRNFHRQQQEPQSHCNMCDLKFLGKIINHRKTEGHQRLKRFLHPKCESCDHEFPSRMEWVDHRFTPDHLRKVHENLLYRTNEEDGALIEEEHPELDNDPLLDESLQTEDEDPILELSDDFKDLQNRIPAYKPSREIAKNNVKPISGYYCDLCIRFMTSEVIAQAHLRTETHYNNFVGAAKRIFKRQVEEEQAKTEENNKRRKAEEESADEPPKKMKKGEDEGEDDATNGEDGNEMYDPEEACQEQESEECIDNAALDEEFAEVDRLIKTAAEQEKPKQEIKTDIPSVLEVREEKKLVATIDTPARVNLRSGAVRNGAGPRSKVRRGGNNWILQHRGGI